MKLLTWKIMQLILIQNIFAQDIYQYKDKNGNTVFTNKLVKNAKKVTLPPLTVYASPMTKNDYNARNYTSPELMHGNLKKMPTNEQRHGQGSINSDNATFTYTTNENGRRQILNEELTHEKQGLEDAVKALAVAKQTVLSSEINNPKQHDARIQALQDTIIEHQKNIKLLSAELAN